MESEQSPDEHQHQNFSLLQLPTIAISRTSDSLILKHVHYLPAILLYVNESDVEWLVRSQEQEKA